MKTNSPLDFLLNESVISRPMFGESSLGEITLPNDDFPSESSGEESEYGDDISSFDETDSDTSESTDPRDLISELKQKISDLKEEITSKLKPLFPEDASSELAEALDDATSSLDLCDHHLTDIDNQLSGEAPNSEEMPPTNDESNSDELGIEGTLPESDDLNA